MANLGAVEAMLTLGWARDEEEEALFVPKGRYFSMAEVRPCCSRIQGFRIHAAIQLDIQRPYRKYGNRDEDLEGGKKSAYIT